MSTTIKKTLRDLIILAILALAVFLYFKIKTWTTNESTGYLTSSEETRSYLLYVPDSVRRKTPAPLVIAFHGYSSKPSDIEFSSRWNDLADKEGFIVVYPKGSGNPTYWRTSATTYAPRDPQLDVQFVTDLIDKLSQEYNIDPNRIYVNGMSMGGGMAHVAACFLADRVAAFGGVAGAYAFPSGQCQPSRPVPFIAFHGTADTTVPLEGGVMSQYNITYPSVPRFMQAWADNNQCQQSTTTTLNDEVEETAYSDCAQNAEVKLYVIENGGHTWPGDDPASAPQFGYTTQQIDAAPMMWEFFKTHPLTSGE